MSSIPTVDAILIDWGTTNARAYLLAGGEVTDRRRRPRGIRQVPPGGFAAALAELLGSHEAQDLPILMSGMIGSRQGWVEVPYRPCPARLEDLAAHLHAVPGRPNVRIVPGLCRADGDGTHHDVMRGEEVQVFGAMADAPHAVLCLPGTHCKWVRYDDGCLADFATAMTGEVFDVLRRHSLLAALMLPADDGAAPADGTADAFRRGLDRSAEAGGLLHHLFGVRTEGLFGAIPAEGLASYLSGMLIGHEIRTMSDLFPSPDPVRLVAEGALAGRYALAFTHLGRGYAAIDAEAATLRGLTRMLERGAPLA
jgi:2-dehydro-3-deoxygalactonokinase